MKNTFNLIIAFCLASSFGYSQGVDTSLVYFNFDMFSLTPLELTKLNEEIAQHQSLSIDSIVINGHTDSFGSVSYNTRLSANRNKTVLNKLEPQFSIPIRSHYHSELNPVETNKSDAGRASNRRVEIIWYYHSGAEDVTNKKVAIEEFTKEELALIVKNGRKQMQNLTINFEQDSIFNDVQTSNLVYDTLAVAKSQLELDSFIDKLKSEPVVRVINPAEDQVIVTENGTLLIVQEGTFITKSGQDPKEVTLKIEEFYDASSIISAGLVTKTNDGVYLETGGMLAINALDENGDSLELQKSISIGMPTADSTGKKRRMKLYQEVKTKNGVQWKLDLEHPNYTKPFDINWRDVGLKALDYTMAQDERLTKGFSIVKKIWLGKEKLRGKDRGIVNNAVKSGQVDKEAVETQQKYLFNTTGFGYINCDRSAFKNEKGERIDVVIEKSNLGKAAEMLYIIFPTVNCLVGPDPGTPFDAEFKLGEIPKGIEMIVLGLKVLEGKYYMAINNGVANADKVAMVYEECTSEEFKEKVNSLVKI